MFCKTSKDWPKNSLVSRKILKILKEVETVTVFTLCGQLSKKCMCTVSSKIKNHIREFPRGPVVRTQNFRCWGPGFNPWLGNYLIRSQKPCCTAKRKKEKKSLLDTPMSTKSDVNLEKASNWLVLEWILVWTNQLFKKKFGLIKDIWK